jgi:hypothetical protein
MESIAATWYETNIKESVQIRAPALQRLGMNLLTFSNTTTSIKSAIEKEGIDFYVFVYPNNYGILSEFPTKDANSLSNEIMKIIRCYIATPEIYKKIDLCYKIQNVGSEIYSNIKTKEIGMNIRAQEMKDLNLALYNISKKIVGQEVVASAKFIKVLNHQFYHESQFVEFIVKTK